MSDFALDFAGCMGAGCRAKPAGDSLVVFYCKSGVRSSNAQAIAMHVGYTQTLNYRGSWMEWADRAYDDEDGGGPP